MLQENRVIGKPPVLGNVVPYQVVLTLVELDSTKLSLDLILVHISARRNKSCRSLWCNGPKTVLTDTTSLVRRS